MCQIPPLCAKYILMIPNDTFISSYLRGWNLILFIVFSWYLLTRSMILWHENNYEFHIWPRIRTYEIGFGLFKSFHIHKSQLSWCLPQPYLNAQIAWCPSTSPGRAGQVQSTWTRPLRAPATWISWMRSGDVSNRNGGRWARDMDP